MGLGDHSREYPFCVLSKTSGLLDFPPLCTNALFFDFLLFKNKILFMYF